jgi:prepilin-type N-terminal cleavage/methylation domain-containing protein
MSRMGSRHRGFSLLEALVTLAIVALVAGLCMQALLQVMALRERVLRHDRDARASALHERWFRDSVGASLPDLPRGVARFEGDGEGVRFLTASPLKGRGVASAGWRLRNDGVERNLEYRQADESWAMPVGPFIDARFTYQAADGRWHAAWPRREVPAEVLPRAVRLAAVGASGRRLEWSASVDSAPFLPPVLLMDEGPTPDATL